MTGSRLEAGRCTWPFLEVGEGRFGEAGDKRVSLINHFYTACPKSSFPRSVRESAKYIPFQVDQRDEDIREG